MSVVGSLVGGTAVLVGLRSPVSAGGTVVGGIGVVSGFRPVQAVKIKIMANVKISRLFMMCLKLVYRPSPPGRQRPVYKTTSDQSDWSGFQPD
jgi:hypothetical protein